MFNLASIVITIIVAIVTLALGLLIGYIIRKNVGEKAIGSAEQKAKNLILDAENRAETIRKEYILEAKEEAHKLRSDADREIRERRAEISKSERRLVQKEESIDRIILINPSDLLELRSVPDTFCKIKQYIVNCPVLGTFIYHIFHTKDCIFNKFINEYFSDPNADFSEISDYYFESAHKDKSGSKYLYASLLGETLNMNIDHGVKVLDKDIIIISGDDYYESDYVPEEYAELNDNIECISIMETSYLPQLENPTKVMDIIEEYWK